VRRRATEKPMLPSYNHTFHFDSAAVLIRGRCGTVFVENHAHNRCERWLASVVAFSPRRRPGQTQRAIARVAISNNARAAAAADRLHDAAYARTRNFLLRKLSGSISTVRGRRLKDFFRHALEITWTARARRPR